jgi:DNA primase
MLRGVDLIIENGLEVRICELADDHDPDSFVRQFGGEAFQKVIDNSISFLDFKAEYFQKSGMLSTAEGKTRAIRSIVSTIAKMKDELRRSVYIKELSSKYGLQESLILREVDAQLGRAVAKPPERKPAQSSGRLTIPATSALAACERDVLKVIFEGGKDVLDFVFEYVQPSMFRHVVARSIAEMLLAQAGSESHFELSSFLDTLPEEAQKKLVTEIVMERHEIGKRWEELGQKIERGDIWKQTEDAIVAMRLRELETELENASRLIHEAEAGAADTRELHHNLRTLQEEKIALQKNGLRQPDR